MLDVLLLRCGRNCAKYLLKCRLCPSLSRESERSWLGLYFYLFTPTSSTFLLSSSVKSLRSPTSTQLGVHHLRLWFFSLCYVSTHSPGIVGVQCILGINSIVCPGFSLVIYVSFSSVSVSETFAHNHEFPDLTMATGSEVVFLASGLLKFFQIKVRSLIISKLIVMLLYILLLFSAPQQRRRPRWDKYHGQYCPCSCLSALSTRRFPVFTVCCELW